MLYDEISARVTTSIKKDIQKSPAKNVDKACCDFVIARSTTRKRYKTEPLCGCSPGDNFGTRGLLITITRLSLCVCVCVCVNVSFYAWHDMDRSLLSMNQRKTIRIPLTFLGRFCYRRSVSPNQANIFASYQVDIYILYIYILIHRVSSGACVCQRVYVYVYCAFSFISSSRKNRTAHRSGLLIINRHSRIIN